MTYNRTKALAYARKYWTKACSDLYIGIGSSPGYKEVPAGTTFVRSPGALEKAKLPDGSLIGGLDDCAHFLSCCLGTEQNEVGGGLPIQRDFPSAIYGVVSARRLFSTLTDDRLIETVIVKANHDAAEQKLSELVAGDLIFYWSPGVGAYGHVAMWLKDSQNRIACHTYCRCDQTNDAGQAWDSVGIDNVSYTLVRVRDRAPLVG